MVDNERDFGDHTCSCNPGRAVLIVPCLWSVEVHREEHGWEPLRKNGQPPTWDTKKEAEDFRELLAHIIESRVVEYRKP